MNVQNDPDEDKQAEEELVLPTEDPQECPSNKKGKQNNGWSEKEEAPHKYPEEAQRWKKGKAKRKGKKH